MSRFLTVSFDGFVYLVGGHLRMESRYSSLIFLHVATYTGISVNTVKSDKSEKTTTGAVS